MIQRAGGEETQLFVKEVKTKGRRYIVCRNEAEAAKDAADRRAIIAALDQQLKRGDKALIGNSAYRRYLCPTSDARAFDHAGPYRWDGGTRQHLCVKAHCSAAGAQKSRARSGDWRIPRWAARCAIFE